MAINTTPEEFQVQPFTKLASERNWTVVHWIPVLWSGWECDYWWAVAQRADGSHLLIASDIGPRPVEERDKAAEMLRGKIVEYEAALEATREALRLIGMTAAAAKGQ